MRVIWTLQVKIPNGEYKTSKVCPCGHAELRDLQTTTNGKRVRVHKTDGGVCNVLMQVDDRDESDLRSLSLLLFSSFWLLLALWRIQSGHLIFGVHLNDEQTFQTLTKQTVIDCFEIIFCSDFFLRKNKKRKTESHARSIRWDPYYHWQIKGYCFGL